MDPNVRARVDTAKSDLDHWSAKLNSAWAEFEKDARSMNVGRWVMVPAWLLEVDGETPVGGNTVTLCLGLCKIKSEWRICLGGHPEEGPGNEFEEDSWTPIADCPRDDRVRATEFIDALATELAKDAEQKASEVEQAVARLAEAKAKLRPGTAH